MSKLPFPSVTLVDPLVDKLAEVEVESLSEKPLDGEIAEVEFEKRSVTIASVLHLLESLEELVIELLAMTLAGKSPSHLAPTWLISWQT